MATAGVRVKGYTELMRAFKDVDKGVRLGLRALLRGVAEPVRADAERLATERIHNLHTGDPWSRMRVGVTTKVVYVAPKQRGGKGFGPQKRRDFGTLLMDEAMEPALMENAVEINAILETALDKLLAREFE